MLTVLLLVSCGTTFDKVQGIQGKKGDAGDVGQNGNDGKDGKDASQTPTIDSRPQPQPQPQPQPIPMPQPAPGGDYGYPAPAPTCPGNGCPNTNTNTIIINGSTYPDPPTGNPPQDTIIVCACIPSFGGNNCIRPPQPPPCVWTTLRIPAKDVNSYNVGYRGPCQ